MNPQYRDLYRRDQQRLADWPPKFRGEGPFLPTGRRRPPRLWLPATALAAALLASLAGVHWRPATDDAVLKPSSGERPAADPGAASKPLAGPQGVASAG